ncbi:MAG: hypothetical protein WBW33_04100, partial [Bryobacteraceae bacterium]
AVVSLLPNSGGGKSVTFTAVYSDPNAAADLNQVMLLVNTGMNAAGACYLYYYPQANRIYLRNDAATAWLAPALTPGAAGTVSNSQCTLDAGSSSVSTAGNNLTLNVALNFSTSFVNSKNVYLYAAGTSGQNSGWVQEGSWTPSSSAGPPAIVSLSPGSGTGASATFTSVYSDPNGASDLNQAMMLVNTSVSAVGACYVYYYPQGNQLYLRNDTATAWLVPALTPGVAGTVSNSQCTLDAGSSSVSTAGNNLTLNLALSFSTSFVNPKNVYLYAAGASGKNSGWVQKGSWTPNPSAGPPAIASLLPNSGGGTPVTFTAVYSDPSGVVDLNQAMLLVNTSVNAAGACYVYYYSQGNQLYLRNDTATAWLAALTPGVAGTVSNSQCTLNAGSSSVSKSGTNLTLNVALSFNSAFTGLKNVYLYAAGASGQNSGWVQKGSWTPNPSAGPPVIVSLSPNSGAGPVATLTAVYSDPNGAGDLSQAMLLLNTSANAAGACEVYYNQQGNQLYLRNDVGTAWLAPTLTPGVAGTVSNSQCTLKAGSSSVSTSGNNLTLNVALTFNSAFVTSKSVYLFAAGLSGQNSG